MLSSVDSKLTIPGRLADSHQSLQNGQCSAVMSMIVPCRQLPLFMTDIHTVHVLFAVRSSHGLISMQYLCQCNMPENKKIGK